MLEASINDDTLSYIPSFAKYFVKKSGNFWFRLSLNFYETVTSQMDDPFFGAIDFFVSK